MLIALGIFGAALLYGDGMITPAITVLGAVEGLKVATPLFDSYVVPIAVAILVGIFAIQQQGTHLVGRLFGPVMVLWFVTIAILGVTWIVRKPVVLSAINPVHAARLLRDARAARLRGAGRGVSGGHRRRGAVRRHGPLRKAADSSGVVRAGPARPPAQLLRSGRAAADRQHRRGTALFPSGAVLGASAHGGAGDGGRHHRLPGAHLGRLLAHPPGRPAWLQPADGHRPHLVAPHGADLRAAGELGADGRAPSRLSSGSGRRARSPPHTASPSR